MNRQAKGPWVDGDVGCEISTYARPVIDLPGRVALVIYARDRGSAEESETKKLLVCVPDLIEWCKKLVEDGDEPELRAILKRAGVL